MSSSLVSATVSRPPRAFRIPRFVAARISCFLRGHYVDNRRFEAQSELSRVCRCGHEYLHTDGSSTRVRHTLSCFFGHHTYRRLVDRDGYHEYVCVQCGHPLVFAAACDPYAQTALFAKKVRYFCGLFGHRVHRVGPRDGFIEHACFCGHSFLKAEEHLPVVRHPAICVLFGHWIRYVTDRGG